VGVDGLIFAVTVFDDGGGPALYVGGDFTMAGGVPAQDIAKWDGSNWAALGTGTGGGSARVDALTVFDDGSGPALYAGGYFTSIGSAAASNIAKWDGSTWTALGNGTDGQVEALAVFDDGGGPRLYAGGYFSIAGGNFSTYIARWNGSIWLPWLTGVDGPVLTIAVFNDGSGAALYAAGYFDHAGGLVAHDIARWSGVTWSTLGSGITGAAGHAIRALTVFDDASGPALYAGGYFTPAGGVAAIDVAKWDGSSWSSVGGGFRSGSGVGVESLAVFDDGSGAALYVGGSFATAGGVAAIDIAKWDGSSWSALGSGMSGGLITTYVSAMTVFDDGSGPALYPCGHFTTAGGVVSNTIAEWGNPPGCGTPNAINQVGPPSPGEVRAREVPSVSEA
jgi:hypothetical protein